MFLHLVFIVLSVPGIAMRWLSGIRYRDAWEPDMWQERLCSWTVLTLILALIFGLLSLYAAMRAERASQKTNEKS